VIRYVADLGNSRIKWAFVGADGAVSPSRAWPLHAVSEWVAALHRTCATESSVVWGISSVNPPVSEEFEKVLPRVVRDAIRWFRSAADVPLKHDIETPATTGADRALAVLAASQRHRQGQAGLVISCGTAITVERISEQGIWEGGAIAPGLSLSAQALNHFTAQLPLIEPIEIPPAWGRSTVPSIQAGVFWGTVGVIRELVSRQSFAAVSHTWRVWTGGDAAVLAPHVDGPGAEIVSDLVLEGLALAAFGGERTE
jgi:type III pantothenate kinase